ncbi:hypothetical protein GFS31_43390 (plasmid) [Leptolyngbya sp. BL0902]|uniref:FUSC family protein n=1 Tax=Leptolyngbya sp. BL0902 TaxID=1115757 RepID=UPI0018E8676B|nr:FUSC family protein [Leptolyngbya sp. BL0902]QQE67626.1 hypothetical protein GFS31_43390 [Leptolyngbya sp. BL0902]
MAKSEVSQLIKQGLSFALGAALLTGLLQNRGDLLDNFAYPIFGFVSVVYQPSQGGAFNAGLGRLGGSALGGLIAATLISAYGVETPAFYVVPALTFIFAALLCETYRWEAAYSQATLVGTFIAMRVLGTSAEENIWRYVAARLIDNWIGIMVGFAVVLLFWPRGSRPALVKGTRQFLQQLPLRLGAMVQRWAPHPTLAHLDAAHLHHQLETLVEGNHLALENAENEFQGEGIYEENWGAILAAQTQLVRQLDHLDQLVARDALAVPPVFVQHLDQFLLHSTATCDQLQAALTQPPPDPPTALALLHQDVTAMAATLNDLRASGAFDPYDAPQVLQGFHQLELCRQLVHSLEALSDGLHQRAQIVAEHRRQPLISLPRWTPLSPRRVIEIVGMGAAIGLLLVVVYSLEYPFPALVYTRVATLVGLAGLLFFVQRTLLRAIAGVVGGIVVIHLLLFWIYLVANAFGFNPASSFLLYFILFMSFALPTVGPLAKATEMIAGPFGFLPGTPPHSIELSRIGAILTALLFAEGVGPFFHEALRAASLSTLMATSLAFVVSLFFITGSEVGQFTQSLADTYRQMGQMYQGLLAHYWLDQPADPRLETQTDKLAKAAEQHELLSLVAGLELGFSAAAKQETRRWNTWIEQEALLLAQLNHLRDHTRTPPPNWLAQRFLADFQAIAQQTTDRFYQVANQVEGKAPLTQEPLLPQLEALETQLLALRLESREYPIAPLVAFSATFSTLKTIAQHLDQAL